MQLTGKLNTPATRFLDFLTNKHETVGTGSHTYSTVVLLTTRAPESCVFNPLLFTPMTALPHINSIIKYVDNTTIICCTINSNDTSYQEEINNLAEWCMQNNLPFSVNKTKGLILDFINRGQRHTSMSKLSLLSHVTTLVEKKTLKRLYFLRELVSANFWCQDWLTFREKYENASWLNTSQTGMVRAWPRTGRLCSEGN